MNSFPHKLHAIVGDDGALQPKSVEYVEEKTTACTDMILVRVQALIHLVHLSMATNR